MAFDPKSLIQQRIHERLKDIQNPKTGKPLTEMEGFSITFLKNLDILITLSVEPTDQTLFQPIADRCQTLLGDLGQKTQVVLTTHHGTREKRSTPQKKEKIQDEAYKAFQHIIAVGSGKGGVGKSTVALNLAWTLKSMGVRVGLVDGDIYGPSLPLLTKIKTKSQVNEDKKLVPQFFHGMPVQSMGFLMDPDQPALWRGPLAQSSFLQLITGTAWDPLDVLIIDLPPGTGDIHISLCQKVPLSGAIVVSTPQALALVDAHKAIKMFRTLETPLIGLIENMSGFQCTQCHHTHAIFDQDKGKALAREEKIPFLGALPINPKLRAASDVGEILMQKGYDDPMEALFCGIGQKTIDFLKLPCNLIE